MNVAITFLFTIIFIFMSFFTVWRQLLSTYGGVGGSWQVFQQRVFHKSDTLISAPLGQMAGEGTSVSLTLVNEGRVALQHFDRWDVLFEVQTETGTDVLYLAYTTDDSPSADEWTVKGIYLDASKQTDEIVDPGVFNPGEEMVIRATLSRSLLPNTFGRAVIAAPNGVTVRMIFEVLPILFVVDESDGLVYRYSGDGTLHETRALDADNANSRGITTDGSDFWTTDAQTDRVYEYTPDFALTRSWSQALLNGDGVGITTNGSNIWVVDQAALRVFKYDMDGNLAVDIPNFALNLENASPTGITTDGNSIWIADGGTAKVYQYTMVGTFVSSFPLKEENAGPTGITTDRNYFWVVDATSLQVYRYTMSGEYLSAFSLDQANTDPQGITARSRSFN